MRRVVPDNSVLVAAYFPEVMRRAGREFNLSARAKPLRTAIEESFVQTFAPHCLVSEFMKVSYDKAFTRQGEAAVAPSVVDDIIADFILLCQTQIDFQSEAALAARAWSLIREHRLPPTDAWFLACAMEVQGELWVSHRQKDGFVQAAQAVYGDVHLLSDEEFKL